MNLIRRLCIAGTVAALAAGLSGCVIRPLWWDGHEHHGHFESGFVR